MWLKIDNMKTIISKALPVLNAKRYCKGNPNSLDEQLFTQDLARGNPK
jgi:hypothetical protein